jgi:hypothetical protein
MFGLAAWNRLLRKQQEEKVVLSAHDVLGQKQISEHAQTSLMYRVNSGRTALPRVDA